MMVMGLLFEDTAIGVKFQTDAVTVVVVVVVVVVSLPLSPSAHWPPLPPL